MKGPVHEDLWISSRTKVLCTEETLYLDLRRTYMWAVDLRPAVQNLEVSRTL
jgi:hypothetical protein